MFCLRCKDMSHISKIFVRIDKHKVSVIQLSNQLNWFNRKMSNVDSNRLPDSIQILKSANTSSCATLKIKSISKAMKAYLERAKKHEDFLKVKTAEYEIGCRHLANIMGLEYGTLTQDDINQAIQYLLPSGLYEKNARPMMKPPEKMFPREKAAQFDDTGRPFSSFFYTQKSNYHQILHDLVGKFHELDAFEDKMFEKGIAQPPKENLLNLSGGEWISIDEIRGRLLENISEQQYNFLIVTLTRLAEHPYCFRFKDVISAYRNEFVDASTMEVIPELMHDENGTPYIEMTGYRKKYCEAKVMVRGNGTGKVEINGTDISYFKNFHEREQIMYPLEFTGMLGKVDIKALVTGVGGSVQAGAIRHGLSLCLRSFVPPNEVEKMRLAGLLTRDRRRKGRKLPGQKGCRAKYTWKKR